MTYDGATGNLTNSISDAGSSSHFNAQRKFAYNNIGQVITATDPIGSLSQFSYDSFGNQTAVVRDIGVGRLNQSTSYAYNAQGDVISVTDPRGNITTNTYDAARRPITTTAPDGLTTTNKYDPDGRIIQTQQSAKGIVLRGTSATYTLTGKPAAATDANGNTTSLSYDMLDRVSSVKDAMNRVTFDCRLCAGRLSHYAADDSKCTIKRSPALRAIGRGGATAFGERSRRRWSKQRRSSTWNVQLLRRILRRRQCC